MIIYELTKEMRSVKRLTFFFMTILFVGIFSSRPPLHICIAGVISLILGLISGFASIVGEEIKLDEEKIHIKVPFKIGEKEVYWNEIISVNAFYIMPFVATMEIMISKDGKHEKTHIPIADFPPGLVGDIVSRLSKDVEVILSSDIRDNYDV